MEDTRQVGPPPERSYIRFLTILQFDSAPGFLNFVSGYTVFLGPITGIIVTDVCPLYLGIVSVA